MTESEERETIIALLHGDECPEDPDDGEMCNCDGAHYERQADIILASDVWRNRPLGLHERLVAFKAGWDAARHPQPTEGEPTCQHEACEIDSAGNSTRCADCGATEGLSTEGEPSDAPTVQFMARRGGKTRALIDQMLAQASERGVRVEVIYPQSEWSDAQVLAALNSNYPESGTPNLEDWHPRTVERMRSALRAAAHVADQGSYPRCLNCGQYIVAGQLKAHYVGRGDVHQNCEHPYGRVADQGGEQDV